MTAELQEELADLLRGYGWECIKPYRSLSQEIEIAIRMLGFKYPKLDWTYRFDNEWVRFDGKGENGSEFDICFRYRGFNALQAIKYFDSIFTS